MKSAMNKFETRPHLTPNATQDAMLDATQSAARVMQRCDQLARCSESATGLTRTFLSPAMDAAHEMVAGWMREAGMTPHVDEMGNLIGHFPSVHNTEDAPLFLFGSHLDTVPNAGKYDGMLGVLLAIEVVETLGARPADLPFALEVIGFSEEEGVRFRTPYLGSRALAGTFDAAFLELKDKNGISMRQAMRHFGLVPDEWRAARHTSTSANNSQQIVGYFEAHIEQGPFLEALGAPLGIVTSIAGQSRVRVRFSGQSGHAGTCPMPLRRDALAAASEWVLAVEALGQKSPGLVATVGILEVDSAASNIVPGEVMCSLDVRHGIDGTRETAVETLLQTARDLCARRGVGFEKLSHADQNAVPMDKTLLNHLKTACEALQLSAPEMVSGAGHDAAIMASLAPCAMLFLRTPGGASHCPEEAVALEDVALAIESMKSFLIEVAQQTIQEQATQQEATQRGELVESHNF